MLAACLCTVLALLATVRTQKTDPPRPEDCRLVECAWPNCEPGTYATTVEGNCCPTCEKCPTRLLPCPLLMCQAIAFPEDDPCGCPTCTLFTDKPTETAPPTSPSKTPPPETTSPPTASAETTATPLETVPTTPTRERASSTSAATTIIPSEDTSTTPRPLPPTKPIPSQGTTEPIQPPTKPSSGDRPTKPSSGGRPTGDRPTKPSSGGRPTGDRPTKPSSGGHPTKPPPNKPSESSDPPTRSPPTRPPPTRPPPTHPPTTARPPSETVPTMPSRVTTDPPSPETPETTECEIRGQVFTECGSACPAVCGEEQPMFCTFQCLMGCQCPSGTSLNKATAECVTQCPTVSEATPTTESTEPDVCTLPRDKGSCKLKLRRYYYNARRNECRQFRYNGCEGNGNRFDTYDECQEACMCECLFC